MTGLMLAAACARAFMGKMLPSSPLQEALIVESKGHASVDSRRRAGPSVVVRKNMLF